MTDWRYELYGSSDGWTINRWDGDHWVAISYPPIEDYADALVLLERLRLQAALLVAA